MAMIITARLKAIPAMDILIMGPENEERASLLKVSRVAMNRPVLNDDFRMGLKDIKYCSNFRPTRFQNLTGLQPQYTDRFAGLTIL
jgi:hypothetical protein